MEIAPVPHRASAHGQRRWLVLGLLVATPVVLLVLLPAVFGLNRSVVTDSAMHGSLGRGAVVLARDVPPDALAPGDVVSFTAPSGPHRGERVTRRIVTVDDGYVVTRADATRRVDPWRLSTDEASYPRVWAGVPWVGLPFVVGGGWLLLASAAALALAVLALLAGRTRRSDALRKAAVARLSRPGVPVA